MSKQPSEFQKNTLVFYRMLCNAFKDEDHRDMEYDKLELSKETDLNETIVAMVMAILIFCEKLDPETFGEEDLLGFTHILNRLVVQHMLADDDEDDT